MGLRETSTILIDIVAQYCMCHTEIFNIMLHHGGRNDVKEWVWYGVWLPVPELFVKKLATMVHVHMYMYMCIGLLIDAIDIQCT